MRSLCADWQIDSAGTSDWHVGDAPCGPMQSAAIAAGYDMSDLGARQFKSDDFNRFDHIVTMDAKNSADVEHLRPSGNTTPVRIFTDFVTTGEDHVPDPYYTRDFTAAIRLIETCAQSMKANFSD